MRTVSRLTTTIASMVLLAAASGCATAPSDAAPPGADVDLDRVICHDAVKTGTRMSKRVCKTAREWEEEAIENKESMRNAQRGVAPRDEQPGIGN